ncbi:vWA domain-containing protein [Gardnerella vaginalis]|uniref:vWA domain-containing protein n=1 Tax=Gardnerella vaginalis TaxID=2702 RepID=UPI0009656440|nr:VWA domain-containing protein [Gardnerella vaginalis]OKY55826.1 von Willebrand factor type A domain protein [Gardnerella vaginalis]
MTFSTLSFSTLCNCQIYNYSTLVSSIFSMRLKWPIVLFFSVLASVIILITVLVISEVKRHSLNNHSYNSRNILESSFLRTFTLDEDLQGSLCARKWRLWNILRKFSFIMLILALICTTILSSRPSRVLNANEQSSSRDIVLCLDVSGSTLPYDLEVINAYLKFVEHFQGERIGLSIFNSTSRTVFPLTDDYSLVKKQLQYASKLLDGVQTQDKIDNMQQRQYQQISTWLDGTQNRKEATSLIGDGLVSCAAMIPGVVYGSSSNSQKPHNRLNRSASIVLATDNVVSGKPVYSLKQALDLTKRANIQVDGLYSGSTQSENENTTNQMRELIEKNGGIFLTQHNSDSVLALVRKIEQQHTIMQKDSTQSALSDDPSIATIFAVIFVTLWLISARRIKR